MGGEILLLGAPMQNVELTHSSIYIFLSISIQKKQGKTAVMYTEISDVYTDKKENTFFLIY